MPFNCSFCACETFSNLRKYMNHLNLIHSHESNLFLRCVHSDCSKSFNNYHSLKTHVYRNHRDILFHETPLLSNSYNCNNCPQVGTFKTLCDIGSHLNDHMKNNETVNCPILNCSAKFNNFSTYKSHLSRKHQSYFHGSTVNEEITLGCGNNPENQSIASDSSGDLEFENFDSALQKHIGLLLLKAQEKHMLPVSTTTKLLQDFSSLIKIQTSNFFNKIKKEASNFGINNEALAEIEQILKGDCVSKSIHSLSTNYKRMEFFKKNMQMVLPEEIFLGENNLHKTCSFQYVPLLKTINFLLNQKDVFEQVVNPLINNSDSIFVSFEDGELCKNHPLFSSNSQTLKINLFCDEFEVCNPLGVHRKIHKIMAFYYVLENIYPQNRSNTDTIQLAILCKTNYVKYFGLENIVEPLIKDLNVLAIEGISVKGETFFGGLSFISGDNLGSNMVGGFVESFSNKVNYYCRTCLCDRVEVQKIFNDDRVSLRTPENYKEHLELLSADNTKVVQFGVKKNSPFNSNFFHVTQGLPPDIAHDLLEGVVPYEMRLVLRALIANKIVSLEYINKQIEMWPYGPLDVIDKPALINAKIKITQTAARMWTLIRLLPLMCATVIPEDNIYWQFFIDLKDLVEAIFAPIFHIDHIAYLKSRIEDHLSFFKELFPEKSVIAKQHFLIHYPSHILKFGPLRHCWTLRFEAKHFYFKRLATLSKNFKNITYTLAKRHQLRQAYQASNSGKYLKDNKSVGTSKPLDIQSLEPEAVEIVLNCKELEGVLHSVPYFIHNSLKYENGLFIVRDVITNPVFSKIFQIITDGDKVYFLVMDYESCYNSHYGAYQLQKKSSDSSRFFFLDSNSLLFKYMLVSLKDLG